MSKVVKNDPRKISSDLFSLTYGSLVFQLVKDLENAEDVNKQLDRMYGIENDVIDMWSCVMIICCPFLFDCSSGYSIGLRLVEDYLAKTNTPKCFDMKDVAEKIQAAFRMYLNITPSITNWSPGNDEFSIILDSNPFAEYIELPDHLTNLRYCNILPGIIRGALEMVGGFFTYFTSL